MNHEMNRLPEELLDYIFGYMGYREKYSLVIHQVRGGTVVVCQTCYTLFPIQSPEDLFRAVLAEMLGGKLSCERCRGRLETITSTE